MFFIFLIFLYINIQAMEKRDITEIVLSENKDHKPTSAVFIDENRVALTGWGKCYILKLKEQERIPIIEGLEYFSMRISPDRKLLAFIDNNRPYVYHLEINGVPKNANPIQALPPVYTRLGIDFCCNNDLILYRDGYLTYHNIQQSKSTRHLLMKSNDPYSNTISCHPTNNNFVCCCNQILYVVHIEKKSDSLTINSQRVYDNMVGFFVKKAQYDFSGKFIGVKTNDKLVFVINSHEVLLGTISNPKLIGTLYKQYEAYFFYPNNENIIVLLDNNSTLEYWDHSVNKLICTQKMLNQPIDDTINPPIRLVCFSPRGRKVLAIINGKILLSNAPVLPTGKTLLIYWVLNIFLRNNSMPKDLLREIIQYI